MTGFLLLMGRHDERILNAMVTRRRSGIDVLMRSVTHLGDAWVTISVALLMAVGWIPGTAALGARVAFTLVVSHLWVQMLKRSVSRERPRLPVGCVSMIDAPDRFSFPSGHAASSLSLVLPVAAAFPGPGGVALLGIGTLVGLSRCYLGVHYPGDVVMGWMLAWLAAMAAGPVLTALG